MSLAHQWVEITFECLPLRSVPRLDIPIDASPKFREQCLRIKAAMAKHGNHNVYYLHNARCVYHLANHDTDAVLEFAFDGVVLTDTNDRRAVATDLNVTLHSETCSWLTHPIVEWFDKTVGEAVRIEFDRYIDAGDLAKTEQRMREIEAASDEAGGFLGMYL